ncbi:hypothetical protein [Streptomyces sp. NPDC088733]|uniref:hypothetical protein n=1 Tax=Streptomyces sp. NPDC088733 TaxID=3365880 RepID=UPI0038023E0C
MRTRTITTALAAAAAFAALTACTTNGITNDKPAADDSVTAASDPGGSGNSGNDKTLGLTQTSTYENKVAVQLVGFQRATSSEYASPGSTPYLRFTVKVTNGSREPLDLNLLNITCAYGHDLTGGEAIFDSDHGLNGPPNVHLRPGRSASILTGCSLPKAEKYVQIEVAPSFESETTVFGGDVK